MKNALKTLGSTGLATNSQRKDNPGDYYGTNPAAVESLLSREEFDKKIWEPCAGKHNISNVLKSHAYKVWESDIFGYGLNHSIVDFLEYEGEWDGDLITNPPYNLAGDFVEKALKIVKPGKKLAMFLRLQFLEGQKRYNNIFVDNPPKTVYVFTKRQVCSKVDDFTEGSAVAYVWIVWEKGFTGDPAIKWIND